MKKMLLAALVAASATALIAPAAATAAPTTPDPVTTASTVLDAVTPPVTPPGDPTAEPAGTKTQWPETLGLPKSWAKKAILRDRPGLEVVYVPEGALVTMEYDENRVRIFHNPFGLVSQVPVIG